jgi:hypothetical protein
MDAYLAGVNKRNYMKYFRIGGIKLPVAGFARRFWRELDAGGLAGNYIGGHN